jgi:CHASE2 domain
VKFHPRKYLHAAGHSLGHRIKQIWPVIPLVLILAALMLADFNDFMDYSPFKSNPCTLNQELEQSGFSSLIYQSLSSLVLKPGAYSATCTSDPAKCYPNVAIVTIDAKSEPPGLLTNTCDSRVFLSRLIKDIDSLGADVIMIDKYYTPESCGEPAKNNVFIQSLEATHAHVVVGRETEGLSTAQSSGCLALTDAFQFKYQPDPTTPAPLPATPDAAIDPNSKTFSQLCHVCYGLTRLNTDTLKIPLHWPVYDVPPVLAPLPVTQQASNLPVEVLPAVPAGDPNAGDGLAWAAVQRSTLFHNQPAANQNLVQAFLTNQIHPYTTFIPIPYTSAMTVLCTVEKLYGNAKPAGDEADYHDFCQGWVQGIYDNLDGYNLSLKGKIVVIGDLSDQDEHFSVVKVNEPGVYLPGGDQAGVFLQANYVQSILDHRFLRAVSTSVVLLMLFLFVVSVYCLYWAHDIEAKPQLTPEQAGLGSLAILLTLYAVNFVALLKFHMFTPVWALWGPIVFVVFRYLEASGHHRSQHLLGELAGRHHSAEAEQPTPPEPPPPPPTSQP